MVDFLEMEQNLSKIQKNKKTVIIGASGGIGRELALELASTTQELVLHGLSQEKLDSLKDEIFENSYMTIMNEFLSYPKLTDISYKFTPSFFTENENDSSKNLLLEHVKTADTLCVCYGPFLQKPIHQMTQSEWLEISTLVFALPGFLTSLALPHMMEHKFGRILLFGGTRTDTINAFKTNSAYAAAKTALSSLVKSICLEYSQYGIRCNAILPGFVETEYVGEKEKIYYQKLLNSDNMIEAKSIAKTANFLLDNEDLNGVLLKVDRGWNI
jgi:NAD(P)-dependent dehydrogenase (short-subunit alcohol dehydrogenase family)